MDWENLLRTMEREREQVEAAYERRMRYLDAGRSVDFEDCCHVRYAAMLAASLIAVCKSALANERPQIRRDNDAYTTT